MSSSDNDVVRIYFDEERAKSRGDADLFDDANLSATIYPWKYDRGPSIDVHDAKQQLVFRVFRSHGPYEFEKPISFKIFDLARQAWKLSGSFVHHGSSDGVYRIALTSIEPWPENGTFIERLKDRILDGCDFPRLVQYVVATKRGLLSEWGKVVFAKDEHLARFHDDLRSAKLTEDGIGRGFDYVPSLDKVEKSEEGS
ncbi:hypothetical protein [Sphingomicrobium clamense]|uniref:Uncharacterized protein n=1 Tax=Sphingomicrobium clamense TaxID=2851013 RepID=A0ABS6V539_9SPHN|nr:hypothetical protein [Sphingomicrobium sp. B8]MBW0144674.1 hypothetical protein [Sphingomicrobium sp. B8]